MLETSGLLVKVIIIILGYKRDFFKIKNIIGDNGGPAIALEKIGDTIYTYLAGIFLYGPADCGVFICDGVFTKVAAYIPWIEINTI